MIIKRKFVMAGALTILAGLVVVLVSTAAFAQQQKSVTVQVLYRCTLWVDLEDQSLSTGWTIDPDGARAIIDGVGVKPTITPLAGDSVYHGMMGKDRNCLTKFDLSGVGNFNIVGQATYTGAPGQRGMDTYNSQGSVSGGTGLFNNATGSYTETGPWIAWEDVDPSTGHKVVTGTWFDSISITIRLAN